MGCANLAALPAAKKTPRSSQTGRINMGTMRRLEYLYTAVGDHAVLVGQHLKTVLLLSPFVLASSAAYADFVAGPLPATDQEDTLTCSATSVDMNKKQGIELTLLATNGGFLGGFFTNSCPSLAYTEICSLGPLAVNQFEPGTSPFTCLIAGANIPGTLPRPAPLAGSLCVTHTLKNLFPPDIVPPTVRFQPPPPSPAWTYCMQAIFNGDP
jgi:hypothetical protein